MVIRFFSIFNSDGLVKSLQGRHGGYLFLFFVVLQVPPFSAGSGENKKQDNSASSVYPVGPEDRTGAPLR